MKLRALNHGWWMLPIPACLVICDHHVHVYDSLHKELHLPMEYANLHNYIFFNFSAVGIAVVVSLTLRMTLLATQLL